MTVKQLERRHAGLQSPARVLGAQIGQEKVAVDVRIARSSAAGNAVLQRYGKDLYASLGRRSAEIKRLKRQAV
jgi:hypothetical protein